MERAGGFRRRVRDRVLLARHPFEPRQKPAEAKKPENKEKWTPSKPGHQNSAKKQTKCRSSVKARDDYGICETALRLGKMPREDLGIGRISDGLANTEQQPRNEQHLKTIDKAGGGRSRGPQKESCGDDPTDLETVDKPAGDKLEHSVGPEERGEQDSELRRRKTELVF